MIVPEPGNGRQESSAETLIAAEGSGGTIQQRDCVYVGALEQVHGREGEDFRARGDGHHSVERAEIGPYLLVVCARAENEFG